MAAENGKILETIISIGGKLDPSVSAAINKAETQLQTFGSGLAKLEKTAVAAAGAAAAAFGALATKIGVDSVQAATDFEKQMSNVATLLDGDVQTRVAELGESLLAVSKNTGAATADLTDGLYNVISALGDSAESLKILETASKAARAGNATTTDSINLLSAVMKGYGDTSAEFAQRVADMSFQVVKLGQTTFPELAASIGGVVPLANTMGMKIEEVNGYMATLTGVTGGASEVATQLQSTLTALLKPSKNMQEAIGKLGYENGQAMIQALGLQKSLLALRETVTTDVEYGNLFGRKEGITFALAATGSQAENVAQKTQAMYDAIGAADKAFGAQTNNLAARMGGINNMFELAKIQIGQNLTPLLNDLAVRLMPKLETWLAAVVATTAEWVEKLRAFDWSGVLHYVNLFIDGLRTVADFVQRNQAHFATLAKIVLTLLAAFHAIQGTIAIFSALSAAVALVTSPVFLTVAAVVALVAAAWFLYDNWDEVCQWCREAWEKFTAALGDLWRAFADEFPATARLLEDLWNATTQAMGEVWEALTKEFITEGAAAASGLRGLWEDLQAAAEIIGPLIVTSWKVTFAAIRTAVEVLSTYTVGLFKSWNEVFSAVSDLLKGDWDGFCQHFKTAGEIMKNTFISVWREIETFIKTVFDHIVSFLQPIVDKIEGMGDFLKNAENTAAGAWDSVKNTAGGAVDSAKKWIGFASGGFTNGPAICGEAGTEAVISFDPRYRAENRAYLATAAEMLGMTAPAPAAGSVINIGGMTFAPVINGGTAAAQDILSQLRAAMPELVDMLETALAERQSHRYA